ncbi:nucleoside triphosphate pyrophosphohydrolase [Virgibacillus pantothenticus]|uniref:nucleoside triphosphate pyrophosphohydrolase n=1 Tax=Virgibacillus pantothenticus TaxID=1473 RepID=UPI0009870C11|nr:nucleoside triphosphate pyrophosphohydrolase [Virgibacillus pantothenticus]
MSNYHKLVRDQIPEIITNNGQQAITKNLTPKEYHMELKKKAEEELREYFQAEGSESALEELADLLEVIQALAKTHGGSFQTIEALRKKKREERGGFDKGVFLIFVQ